MIGFLLASILFTYKRHPWTTILLKHLAY
jgi:hypothetical protein